MKNKIVILSVLLIHFSLFFTSAQNKQKLVVKIIPSQRTSVVFGEITLDAYLYNKSETNVLLFDHKNSEPAWGGFEEGWFCNGKIIDRFLDAPTSKYNKNSFIYLKPGDSIWVDVIKYVSYGPGKFSFKYHLSANRGKIKKYTDDPEASKLAQDITEYDLSSVKSDIVYKGFDIPDDKLQDLTLEQLKDKDVFNSLEEAAKNPAQVFSITLSRGSITNEMLVGISCFKNLHRLTFYNESGFDTIPGTFKNLKFLKEISIRSDGEFNGVKLFLSQGFFALAEIETIEINNFQIPTLSKSFENLKSLKQLIINNCEINAIEFDVSNLKQLEALNLAMNKISSIKKIDGLPKLSGLGLSKNLLQEFPELTNTPSLSSISLSDNKIKSCPESLSGQANLTTLDLSKNGFTEFPLSVCKIKDLQILNISDNSISSLPKEIVNLLKLTNIYINNCGYKVIQPELFQLAQLNTIELKNNGILVLPDEFNKLPELWLFDISGNKIEQLPESLLTCKRLRNLNVYGNPIKKNSVAKELLKKNKSMYNKN